LERQARRLTQRLVLIVQACLMLQHADGIVCAAFIGSRFDADWGAVSGIGAATSDPASVLATVWA
jgi:putative acyl-CoA dehydrogenase